MKLPSCSVSNKTPSLNHRLGRINATLILLSFLEFNFSNERFVCLNHFQSFIYFSILFLFKIDKARCRYVSSDQYQFGQKMRKQLSTDVQWCSWENFCGLLKTYPTPDVSGWFPNFQNFFKKPLDLKTYSKTKKKMFFSSNCSRKIWPQFTINFGSICNIYANILRLIQNEVPKCYHDNKLL